MPLIKIPENLFENPFHDSDDSDECEQWDYVQLVSEPKNDTTGPHIISIFGAYFNGHASSCDFFYYKRSNLRNAQLKGLIRAVVSNKGYRRIVITIPELFFDELQRALKEDNEKLFVPSALMDLKRAIKQSTNEHELRFTKAYPHDCAEYLELCRKAHSMWETQNYRSQAWPQIQEYLEDNYPANSDGSIIV